MRNKPFGFRAVLFVLFAAVFTAACALGGLLDACFDTAFIGTLIKLGIIAAVFGWAVYKKELRLLWDGRFFTLFLLLGLAPAVFNFLAAFGTADAAPTAADIISYLFAVLTTAVWEELFFRYAAKSLFEEKGEFPVPAYLLVTIVFAASHLVNLFFYEPVGVILQTIGAFTFGTFLLALYLKTKNILVAVISHFLNNFAAGFPALFVTDPANRFWGNVSLLLEILWMIFLFGTGLAILMKYKLLQKNRHE